ncbi:uncharacterized protein LOC142564165 isoform X1 [Dermacentor variabilis]|uniref:uncharacterized protein LOC142564165 isoform X1 n=1 Tax=Dermacentor variabilis TaxID=34621 RepID=UPI003F5B8BC1
MFFREFLACFCVWLLAQSTTSANNEAMTNKNAVPIGENVTLHAHVTYDSAFSKKKTLTKSELQSSDHDDSTATKQYFESLFKQVEIYFRNHSIMITVTVSSVSKNDNVSGNYSTPPEVDKTMEKVKEYGNSLYKSNDTIFYHFTWSTTRFNQLTSSEKEYAGGARFATSGTFCTQNISAALIRHRYGSGVYWTTVKATTMIFGSAHFMAINMNDRKKMNETFSRCPKREETGNIPAC